METLSCVFFRWGNLLPHARMLLNNGEGRTFSGRSNGRSEAKTGSAFGKFEKWKREHLFTLFPSKKEEGKKCVVARDQTVFLKGVRKKFLPFPTLCPTEWENAEGGRRERGSSGEKGEINAPPTEEGKEKQGKWKFLPPPSTLKSEDGESVPLGKERKDLLMLG